MPDPKQRGRDDAPPSVKQQLVEWMRMPAQIVAAFAAVGALLTATGYMPWFSKDQSKFESSIAERFAASDNTFRENLAYLAGAMDERVAAIAKSVEGLVQRSDSMEWTRLEARRLAGAIQVDERIRYCELSVTLGLEGIGCRR